MKALSYALILGMLNQQPALKPVTDYANIYASGSMDMFLDVLGLPGESDKTVKFWLTVFFTSEEKILTYNKRTLDIHSIVDNNDRNLDDILRRAEENEFFKWKVGYKEAIEQGLSNASPYLRRIKSIFAENNLPEDFVYIALGESAFNIDAHSAKGAAGIWQFLPSTARKYNLRKDAYADERIDPIKSTRAAAKYLSDVYSNLKSWPLAILAYNQGELNVQRFIDIAREGGTEFKELNYKLLTFYIPEELFVARNFVPITSASIIIANNSEQYGINIESAEPLDFDEFNLKRQLTLKELAYFCKVTVNDIKKLNPDIKKPETPPITVKGDYYTLKLPKECGERFSKRFKGSILPK